MELNTLNLPIAQWLHRVLITDLKQFLSLWNPLGIPPLHMEAQKLHWGKVQADLQHPETSSLWQPSCLPDIPYESPGLWPRAPVLMMSAEFTRCYFSQGFARPVHQPAASKPCRANRAISSQTLGATVALSSPKINEFPFAVPCDILLPIYPQKKDCTSAPSMYSCFIIKPDCFCNINTCSSSFNLNQYGSKQVMTSMQKKKEKVWDSLWTAVWILLSLKDGFVESRESCTFSSSQKRMEMSSASVSASAPLSNARN